MNAEHPAVAIDPVLPAARAAPDAAPAPRLRRPEPARTAPLRHAATLLRDTTAAAVPVAAAAAAAAPPAPAPSDSAESPVARGVRLGYQVIEEQILQGQKLAARLGRAAGKAAATVAGAAAPAPGETGVGSGDMQELLDRVVHLYKDMGALCVDAVDTLVHHPVLRSGLARMAPGTAQAPAAASTAVTGASAAHDGPGGGFALDIRCSRRTQVTLDLPHRPGSFTPRVHALHAGDPALAPLTGVRFGSDDGGGAAVLHLDIGDAQPAATYTGVVVDAASNQPRGTLSVRLLD